MAVFFPTLHIERLAQQFARLDSRFVHPLHQDAIVVPQRSVNELQGGYKVAVVDDYNKLEFRWVKVSDRFGTDWIIEEGLKPGERVIVEGLQKVRSGAVVDPKPYVSTGAAKN